MDRRISKDSLLPLQRRKGSAFNGSKRENAFLEINAPTSTCPKTRILAVVSNRNARKALAPRKRRLPSKEKDEERERKVALDLHLQLSCLSIMKQSKGGEGHPLLGRRIHQYVRIFSLDVAREEKLATITTLHLASTFSLAVANRASSASSPTFRQPTKVPRRRRRRRRLLFVEEYYLHCS